MSQFPHLTQCDHPHSELYNSEEILDLDATYTSKLDYQVDTQDKDIAVNVTQYGNNQACFIFGEKHIPFLEQLLSDLKEVTK
ncbi:hypothetical protein I907_gp44 [Bacillus phage Eoghan]|uniref:Uncharacterized protein n=2 Tax=Andromedavirus TaxID=1623275 RepID=M1I959_9CAUD|nr:hypothetical protein I907_gp44 [Bacillus phage Eoghan]YP_009592277.1 hypothetical protein FDG68_gp44 [Bacillus phage Taylor]AGE60808.1 hypothetical protein EOGHAN_45 [Bacillus phage Eoghan]AGE60962.1 hypothetical protein TAYLOR_44 [Bacillus phage Taylor]